MNTFVIDTQQLMSAHRLLYITQLKLESLWLNKTNDILPIVVARLMFKWLIISNETGFENNHIELHWLITFQLWQTSKSLENKTAHNVAIVFFSYFKIDIFFMEFQVNKSMLAVAE